MVRIQIDLDQKLRFKSYCPAGEYGGRLISVDLKEAAGEFQFLELTFEVASKGRTYYPVMVCWLTRWEGELSNKHKVMFSSAFGRPISAPEGQELHEMVGKKVTLEIIKGEDINWNDEDYETSKIKALHPWSSKGSKQLDN
jgi:hypothetical protein